VAVPVNGVRKCFKFAILDQRDMPDDLRVTSAQYEDVTFNEYRQAALNSRDPEGHTRYQIRSGKYHFFPNTWKKGIDLEHLMHAHDNQTYCQGTSFCIGENHVSWKNQQYSFFQHIHL